MAYQSLTKNGFDLFEVVSALQKEVRRCNTDNALFWSMELYPNYGEYLWRRLKVICVEDIGLAKPYAPMYLQKLYDVYADAEGKKKKGSNVVDGLQIAMLTQAATMLCEANKSRFIDEAGIYHFNFRDANWKKQIPTHGVDLTGRLDLAMQVTRSGFSLGDVIGEFKHCLLEKKEEAMYWAWELHPLHSDYMWDVMLEVASTIYLSKYAAIVSLQSLKLFCKEFVAKETGNGFQNSGLFVADGVFMLLTRKEDIVEEIVPTDVISKFDMQIDGGKEIPDYALDCHTKRGKAKGRGNEHFYEVAGVINKPVSVHPKELEYLKSNMMNYVKINQLNKGFYEKFTAGF